MKFFKLLAILSIIVFNATGCSISTETPESLFEKPKGDDVTIAGLHEGLEENYTANYTFTLPSNSTDVGKLNEVDLDNDGKNEVVVFEKKEGTDENPSEVGFKILTKKDDETFIEAGEFSQEGNQIEYANFYDLDSDGYKEIILLIEENHQTNMYIYRFKENELTRIYSLNPTWLSNRNHLTDLKIDIGYIDEDDKLDILMLHLDSVENKVYASLVNFDGEINLVDYIEFTDIDTLNNIYTTIGNVSGSKLGELVRGVVIDTPMKNGNGYNTEVVYVEDNTLKKAFDEEDVSMSKAYYIPVEDINDDSILEIPTIEDADEATYSDKSSSTVTWQTWNGKSGEESKLLFSSQVYYNYKYNYYLKIPNALVGKLKVREEYTPQKIAQFIFYIEDFYNGDVDLFTITASKDVVTEESKTTQVQTDTVLDKTDNYTFILNINNVEEIERLNINPVDFFEIIY